MSNLDTAYQKEQQRIEARAERRAKGLDNLFRFGLKQGEAKEVVILDSSLDDGKHFHEHNFKGPSGYYDQFAVCCKEFAHCPLCDQHKESQFILYLSILTLNAYKDKDGAWKDSRNLLGIKFGQLPDFREVLKFAEKDFGTLRGVVLYLKRPKGEKTQSPRIGNPVEIPDVGRRYDFIEDLEAEYGHPAVKSEDGAKIFKEANLDITPFDYDALWPEVDDEDLCLQKVKMLSNQGPVAGSPEDTSSWTEEEDEDENLPRRSRSRSRRRSEDEESDDPKPSKKRARGRSRARREEPEVQEEEETEGEWAD